MVFMNDSFRMRAYNFRNEHVWNIKQMFSTKSISKDSMVISDFSYLEIQTFSFLKFLAQIKMVNKILKKLSRRFLKQFKNSNKHIRFTIINEWFTIDLFVKKIDCLHQNYSGRRRCRRSRYKIKIQIPKKK